MLKMIALIALFSSPACAEYTGGVVGGAVISPFWYAPDGVGYVTISSKTVISNGINSLGIDPTISCNTAAGEFLSTIGGEIACSVVPGFGAGGTGNVWTTAGGTAKHLAMFDVGVSTIADSGIDATTVRTTTSTIPGSDISGQLSAGVLPANVLLSTDTTVARTNQDNAFSATQTFLSSTTIISSKDLDSIANVANSTTSLNYLLSGLSTGVLPELGTSIIGISGNGVGVTGLPAAQRQGIGVFGASVVQGYGIVGVSSSTSSNSFGTVGMAVGGGTNYGVYGKASGGTTNYAGYFSGNVRVTGTFDVPSGVIDVATVKVTSTCAATTVPTTCRAICSAGTYAAGMPGYFCTAAGAPYGIDVTNSGSGYYDTGMIYYNSACGTAYVYTLCRRLR